MSAGSSAADGRTGVGDSSLELRKAQGRQTWGQLTKAEDESERGERKFRILASG